MYNALEKLKIQNKISPALPEIQSMKHFALKNAIEQFPCSGRNSLQFDYYIQEHTHEVFLIGKAELNGDVVVTHTGIYQSKTTGADLACGIMLSSLQSTTEYGMYFKKLYCI